MYWTESDSTQNKLNIENKEYSIFCILFWNDIILVTNICTTEICLDAPLPYYANPNANHKFMLKMVAEFFQKLGVQLI